MTDKKGLVVVQQKGFDVGAWQQYRSAGDLLGFLGLRIPGKWMSKVVKHEGSGVIISGNEP